MIVSTRIYFDKEEEEYQVQVIQDGKLNIDKTYFTDDLDDALDTQAAMSKEILKHPERYR